MEVVDESEHIRYTAGNVFKAEFYQHNAGFCCITLEIPNLVEFCICFSELFLRTFRINEQGVGIYRLVIADSGDVDTERGETFACFQKCADMVGHRGYVCLFQCITSIQLHLFSFAMSFLRISTRLTLPLMVLGSSVTNSTILGYL